MEESLKELNNRLDKIEPVLMEYQAELNDNSSGITELKQSSGELLKLHKIVPNVQKSIQNEATRIETLQSEIEQAKADIDLLNSNVENYVRKDKVDVVEKIEEEVKQKLGDFSLLEKKLVLAVQESEVNSLEGVTKIASEFSNQVSGYKEFMKRYIEDKMQIHETKKDIEQNDHKTQKDFKSQIKDSLASLICSEKEKKLKDEIKEWIGGMNAVEREILEVKAKNGGSGTELQTANRILEDIKCEYRSLNEELELELSQLSQAIMKRVEKYLIKEKTSEEGKRTANDIKKFKFQVNDLRSRFKERKAINTVSLGRITKFVQEIAMEIKNTKLGCEIIEAIKKEKSKLEAKMEKTEESYDRRILQLEQKVNLAIFNL